MLKFSNKVHSQRKREDIYKYHNTKKELSNEFEILKITHATDSYSVSEIINEGLVRQSLLYLLCGKCPCYNKEIRRAQSQNLNLKLCALSIYYI